MKEILKRVSVREYLDKEIEKEKIEKMLLAGMSAPSAKNQRAFEFMVVDDKKLLLEMSKRNQYHFMTKDAALVIVVLGNKNKATSLGYLDQDLAAATENILLEATHLGIGSCWLGVQSNEKRMNDYKEMLNLDDNYFAFSVIALGYPKKEIIKERKYDESIVHYNKLYGKF